MSDEHRRAKAAFRRAMDRWWALPKLGEFAVVPMTSAELAQVLEEAHATAVEALLWARAFSDAARGCDGIAPLTGFPGKIEDLPEGMRAARYVANKGVHQLVELADVHQLPTIGPWGAVPYGGGVQVAMMRWVADESALPVETSRDKDVRPAFVNRWLGQLVEPCLLDVEEYLARW